VKKYVCDPCGYVYDSSTEDNNVLFENLPADWVCPLCGASKDAFNLVESEEE